MANGVVSMQDRTRSKPQLTVTFYTETGNLVTRAVTTIEGKMDDAVIYAQTKRNLGEDSPTFVIELARTKEWHKWIASNDLVKIEMHRPPEAKRTVMVGLVDDVRKTVNVEENTPRRTITVTGRGVAKAFIQFDVGMVPEADYVPSMSGWLLAAGVTVSQSEASVVISAIWEKIASKFINYQFSNGYKLFELIRYNLQDRPNMRLLDDSNVAEWQGSLWGLMKDIAEEPFYELFWEISKTTNLPELFMRPTPFNSAEWNKLRSHDLTDIDVVLDETGRSDVETYTIYSVGAQTLFSTNDPYKTFGQRPLWYAPFKDKYGIRRLHVETKYMSTAEAPSSSVVDIMASLMEDLYNWNIKNASFYNGNIVTVGNPKYQIGERLRYMSDEDSSLREFYIQGVTQEFRPFERWTTTLEVTRGCHPSDRFTSPVGKATEYSGMGLVEFNPEMAQQVITQGGLNDEYVNFLEGGGSGGTNNQDALAVVAGAKSILNNGINGVMVRYVFGGNSPAKGSLDCSSFTQYVFKTYGGVGIGRTTSQQRTAGIGEVRKGDLLPGDLVLFKNTYASGYPEGVSHVGIYIGGGDFIHNASGPGKVTVNNLSESYWTKHWLKGRRVFAKSFSDGGTGGGGGNKPSGTPTEYVATAYGAEWINLGAPPTWKPSYKTASGTTPKEGRTIAADKTIHPLGSKVYIECPSHPSVNGEYIVEDVGGAIKGKRIDIYFDDIAHLGYDTMAARNRMLAFGKRKINVWKL